MKEEIRFLKALIKETKGHQRTQFTEQEIYRIANSLKPNAIPNIEWLKNNGYLIFDNQNGKYFEVSFKAYDFIERRKRDIIMFWIAIATLALVIIGLVLNNF